MNREALSIAPMAYHRRLLSYFGRRISNHADAEDLTQEVLCRVYSSDLGGVVKLDGYIFGIAANLLKDQIRKAALRRKYEPECGRRHSEQTSGQIAIDPERVAASRQMLDCVSQALRDMPPRSRDIFILFRVYDHRQKQLATDFGISVSSVEKHIVKASVILAKRVGHLYR